MSGVRMDYADRRRYHPENLGFFKGAFYAVVLSAGVVAVLTVLLTSR